MNYSVNQIKNIVECDALIETAMLKKVELDNQKVNDENRYKKLALGPIGTEGELAAIHSEISELETSIAVLPESPLKFEFNNRLVQALHKKSVLEEQRECFRILALLHKEYALGCIEKSVAETEKFIAALNQRKSEL